MKLTHQPQNELLAAIREVRTASRTRAAEYHTQRVEEIESILTEPQRQQIHRLYRDEIMNLQVLWQLQLAQLELGQDSSLIQLLRSDTPDLWLTLPNQWHYRISGRLATEKFVSEHVRISKVNNKDVSNGSSLARP